MSLFLLSLILILTFILLVVLTLSSSRKASSYFALTVLFVFLWTLSILLTEADADHDRILLWSRLSFLFPLLMVLSLYPFTYVFTSPEGKRRIFSLFQNLLSALLIIGGCLFSYLSMTPLVLRDVINLHSQLGPLDPAYSGYLFLSFAYIVYLLSYAHRKWQGRTRAQLQFILLGIGVSSLLAIITNLVIPLLGLGEIRVLGPLGLIFFIGATGYAILAHQLFDVRIIIKRTVVYTLLLGFIFAVYSTVIFTFANLLDAGSSISRQSFIANLIGAIVIGFTLDPLRRWLEEKTDHFLFRKEYEEQTVLKELSKKLNDVVALDEALEIVMQTLVHTLHLHHAVTFIFQAGEHGQTAIKRIRQIGYGSTAHLYLGEKDLLIPYFAEHQSILLVEDLKHQILQEKTQIEKGRRASMRNNVKLTGEFIRQHSVKKSVIKKLTELDATLVIPLNLGQQLIGLILLSDKLSGELFNRDDMALLETVGSQAISSIQKAKLYEGDQMKSEFVSIASHELLTPISAIEGYLSMILDENIGKVDPLARDYLTKVYASSKRLSMLIKDLLSVSRIEAGRMKIEPQSLDIEKSIDEALAQLKFMAQEKKLELTYQKPEHPLPAVLADPDRTMQVLVNLISNAIKYTPAGSISIQATHLPSSRMVRVDVKDTGMGMSTAAQAHLFEKFYRVDSPETTGIMGTGLGLYITKSIIERQGGQITVKSTPGQGSQFSFTLPVFQVENSSAA